MSETTYREIHLKSRPAGVPTADNFALVERPRPSAGEGQMLIRNIWMTVDPYMRGRMIDRKSYVPPFQVGEVLDGGSVGQVVESNGGPHQVGEYVFSFGSGGWREYYVTDGKGLIRIAPTIAPLQAYMGTLGMPGLTAYAGLLRIGEPKAGETVFVSAASGAVGSIVCQIAKIKGCRVVGSAGSDEKIEWLLTEGGCDAAINYKTCGDLHKAVAEACPDGIDIYFENVGGEHLQVALDLANPFGRFVMCGAISQYNATEPVPGPTNLFVIIGKSLKLQGFIVTQYRDMIGDFTKDMGSWIAAGQIKWRETVLEGIENAPEAFMNLFSGKNFGKMLVRLGPDSID